MARDSYTAWLQAELLQIDTGSCSLRMKVLPDMCNGFRLCHGGVTFAFADSCFAFACNSHGRHAVSVESSISHTSPAQEGDILIAVAEEQQLSNRLAVYYVRVYNEVNEKTVALFKGTCFRKETWWELV